MRRRSKGENEERLEGLAINGATRGSRVCDAVKYTPPMSQRVYPIVFYYRIHLNQTT